VAQVFGTYRQKLGNWGGLIETERRSIYRRRAYATGRRGISPQAVG
jgi:hypothetical protein